MPTATANPKSPATTCKRCNSKNLEEVGEPTRREISGFDERTKKHYSAIVWLHLRCQDCRAAQSKRVLIAAKRTAQTPKQPASRSPKRPKAAIAEECAKSAPTLRKISQISNQDTSPLVSIPLTTQPSDYSPAESTDNVDEQRRENRRTKRDPRRRRD